jgi:hypothetical protein
MNDDLMKRLRSWSEGDAYLAPVSTKEMIDSAADRIEELEAALRLIADGARDVDKSYISLFHELQFEARTALGENNP